MPSGSVGGDGSITEGRGAISAPLFLSDIVEIFSIKRRNIMNEYHIEFYEKGNHHSAWMEAYSAAQAVYKYIKVVPGRRWLMGLYKKGAPSVRVTMERGIEQLALY